MSSLQTALSKSSLPPESVEFHYGAFTALTERLLGTSPKFLSLAHASPLTMNFFLGAFRLCFRAPYCDMYLLRITPEHRRMVILESSITHQCPYCIGHAAAFGDMLRGPVVQQCAMRGDLDLNKSHSEATLKQLIHEVASFPGQLTPDTRASFVRVYGEDGFKQLAAILSFMGFLNFVMSATGMHLESRLIPFAELALGQKDINVNFRRNVLDDDEERFGEEEVQQLDERMGPMGWLFAQLRNAVQCMMLAVPTASALMAEKRWFGGIPNGLVELDAWCLENLGVLMEVLKNVDDIILKRAVGLSLKLVFVDDSAWTLKQKITFLYVFAVGVGNAGLKDDAMALYKARITADNDQEQDVTMSDLAAGLEVARSSDQPSNKFSAALRYIDVCAGPGDRITKEIIDGLLGFVGVHRDIVDLAGMIGHFGLLNRAAVLYPARE